MRSHLRRCVPRAVAAGRSGSMLCVHAGRVPSSLHGDHIGEVEPAAGPKCRKPRGLALAQGSGAEEIGLEGAGEGPYGTILLPAQDVVHSHHVLPPASCCASHNRWSPRTWAWAGAHWLGEAVSSGPSYCAFSKLGRHLDARPLPRGLPSPELGVLTQLMPLSLWLQPGRPPWKLVGNLLYPEPSLDAVWG